MGNILARNFITISRVEDGAQGDPAEFYSLHPLREEARVNRNAQLNTILEYEVRHHSGGTFTVVNTMLNPSIRVACEICTVGVGGVCMTQELSRGEVSSLTYNTSNYHHVAHPVEFKISLFLFTEVLSTRIVPVIFDPAASLDIDNELGEIRTTVQGPAGNGGLVQSVSILSQRADGFDLSIRTMKPGGGNRFVNGDFSNGTTGWRQNKTTPTWGVRTDIPGSGFPRVLTVDAGAYQGVFADISAQPILYPMTSGLEHVISFWAKADRNNVPFYFGFEGLATKDITLSTTWTRYFMVGKPASNHTVIFYPRSACTFYLAGMQIERGTQPSEWDNAAELLLATGINIRDRKVTVTSDIFEVKNNMGNTTALIDQNGHLTTSLINVDDLFAQNIDAKNGHIDNLNVDSGTIGKFVIGDYSISSTSYTGSGSTAQHYYMMLSRREFYLHSMTQNTSFSVSTFRDAGLVEISHTKNRTGTEANIPNIGTYYNILNAKANFAFCGKGHGTLDSMVEGYNLQRILFTANIVLSLRKGNRFRLISAAAGLSVTLPTHADVAEQLGNRVVGSFFVRLLLASHPSSFSCNINGRPSGGSTLYPQLINASGQNVTSIALAPGRIIEVFLVYDWNGSSDGDSNVNNRYTAYIK